MTICCLGDLVLDVIVRLEQPLATGADATSRIVLRPGGQAANVAAWVAALGGSARFVGKRGADDAGTIAASRLRELGVELLGPVEPTGNGIIVSLVDPSGERTMCADRGVAVELRPRRSTRRGSRTAATCTSRGTRCCASRRFAAIARGRVRRVRGSRRAMAPRARSSVDLSSWSAIRDSAPSGSAPSSRARARRRLRERGRGTRSSAARSTGATWILKRGAAGASFDGDERPAVPSSRRRHDRCGRRLRGRLARRRAGARARGRRTLRAARRIDAGAQRR